MVRPAFRSKRVSKAAFGFDVKVNRLQRSPKVLDEFAIPTEVYIPLVDSLYQEARSLLIGYFMVTGAILLTFWKSERLSFLVCAIVFTAIIGLRALDMRAYARVRHVVKTNKMAKRWEHRYGAGVASTLATLGAWCWLALSYPGDEYARVVSFSITIAYVIGITGRNFGSRQLVVI